MTEKLLIFVSSVQKEFADERKALREFFPKKVGPGL